MSARDDQPATVPPPIGEDDAYSATTKVGAMPADLMEKLRAEGLLPDEPPPEETPAQLRPSTSLDKRRAPTSTPPDDARVTMPGNLPVPALYSNAPPPRIESTKPPPGDPGVIETPVAFAFPPEAGLAKLAAMADASTDAPVDGRPEARRPPSKLTLYLVAAFVVVALVVALLRLAG